MADYVTISLRMPADLHERLRAARYHRRVSITSLIISAVETAVRDYPEVNGEITEENGA